MTAVLREPCARGLIDAEPCPEELGRVGPILQRRLVLAACILASSMAFIDGSALTVALPALRDDLNAGLGVIQWVLNAYILALAAFVLVGGAMADVYGKARMLTIGCIAFGAASAWCALADAAAPLIIARFVQGLAAAVVAPASLALIGAVYPKADRNKAIGVWASASALTTAAGPMLGGWLTETFGWPAIFWLNPPLAAATVALLIIARPADHVDRRAFDIPGAAILVAGLALLAFGLSGIAPGEAEGLAESAGAEAAGGSPALALLAIIGAGAILFGYVRWEGVTDHAMTPPRLFAERRFALLNLATLFLYAALSILFFLMPFELIDRRALSATLAGAAFLPFTLAVGFLAPLAGARADRFGVGGVLFAGAICAAAAFAYFALARGGGFILGILGPMALLGVAFAMIVGPLTAAVISSVEARDEGLASGVSNAASRIAQLVGVAVAAGLAGIAAGYVAALVLAGALSLGAAFVFRRLDA